MQTAAEKTELFPASFMYNRTGFAFSVPSTRLTRSFAFGFSAWLPGRGPMASFHVHDARGAQPFLYARYWLLFPSSHGRHTWSVRHGA